MAKIVGKAKAKAKANAKFQVAKVVKKNPKLAKVNPDAPIGETEGLTVKGKRQVLASGKKKAALKRPAAMMQKPAADWTEWAAESKEEDEEIEEEGEEVEGKDSRPTSKQQNWVFSNALAKHTGVPGALPQEVKDLWHSLHGPGTIPERNALRNMMVPRNAGYGHMVQFQDGAMLEKMKQVFHTKQNRKQTIGMSETEMLLKFHGDKAMMQEAIDKNDIRVSGRFYYWDRDIHEDISGASQSFKFTDTPKNMSSKEVEDMLSVLGNAVWAEWGNKPNHECNPAELKAAANHDSEAMKKLQEGFDAMKSACKQMQNLFTQTRSASLMGKDSGSIPSLMTDALKYATKLEESHCQPMAAILYDPDEKGVSVASIKTLLSKASPQMANLMQKMNEVKFLIQKHKASTSKGDT